MQLRFLWAFGFVLLLVGFTGITIGPVQAEELDAQTIIDRAADSRRFDNSIQRMRLTSYLANGRSKARESTSWLRTRTEGAEQLTDSLLRFDSPADVAGVHFLSVENASGNNDQWLYYPADEGAPAVLNRIVGRRQRQGRFMGTDFTYEDLEFGDITEGNHTRLADADLVQGPQTYPCHVIQSIPTADRNSQYTRIVSWIDRDRLLPRQVDFFKDDEQVKRMTILEYRQDGTNMVPTRTVMEDLRRSTRTEMELLEVRMDVPAAEIPADMFTPAYLEQEG